MAKREAAASTHVGARSQAAKTIRDLIRITMHNNDINRGDGIEVMFGPRDIVKAVYAAYDQFLPDATEKYNASQRRNRHTSKIVDNYVQVVDRDENKHVAAEVILQIGDMDLWAWQRSLADDDPDKISREQIKDAYMRMLDAFCDILPGFKPAAGTIHWDEASPHMHVVGIPVFEVKKTHGQPVIECIPGVVDRKGKPIPAPEMVIDKKTGQLVVSMTKKGNPRTVQARDPDTGELLYHDRVRNATLTYDIAKSVAIPRKALDKYHDRERELMEEILPTWGLIQREKGLPANYQAVPAYKRTVDRGKADAEKIVQKAEKMAAEKNAEAAKAEAANLALAEENARLMTQNIELVRREQAVRNAEKEQSEKASKKLVEAENQAADVIQTAQDHADGIITKANDQVAQILADYSQMQAELTDAPRLQQQYNQLVQAVEEKKQRLHDEGATNEELVTAVQAVYDQAQPDMRDLVGAVIASVLSELEDNRALQEFCCNNDLNVSDYSYSRR